MTRAKQIKLLNACERVLALHRRELPNHEAYTLLYGERGPFILAADLERLELLRAFWERR